MAEVKHRPGNERALALLLGGCLYDEGTKIKVVNKRARQGHQHSREEIKKDTQAWEKDFAVTEKFMQRRDISIWKSVPTQFKATKAEAASLIRQFFELESDNHHSKITYVIYWCGHGEPDTGNWCFSD